MGCFLSTNKRSSPPNPAISPSQINESRTTPPTTPLLEEETVVKEVLSETPSTIQPKPIIPTPENNSIPKKLEDKFSITFEQRQKHYHDSVLKIAKIFNPTEHSHEPNNWVGADPKERSRRGGSDTKEAIKELSRSLRVGSDPKEPTRELSRGIRVGSDTRKAIPDAGAQLRQRSPAKCRSNSPARRSELSPGRVRAGAGRNSGGLSRKENNGESSFRRSRSPVVMCGENDGTRNSISRCPSARKTGKSPGRVRSELGDRRRMPVQNSGSYRENNKGSLTGRNNESLENPLVSMECFIFL